VTPLIRHHLNRAAETAAETYGSLLAAKQHAERLSDYTAAGELESLAAIALDLHAAIGEQLDPTAVDGTNPNPSK